MARDNPFALAEQALARADMGLLDQAVAQLERSEPRHPYTWFLKAERAARTGDVKLALGLSANALLHVPQLGLRPGPEGVGFIALGAALLRAAPQAVALASPLLDQFGRLAVAAGVTQRTPGVVEFFKQRIADPMVVAQITSDQAVAILRLLGWNRACDAAWADLVFQEIVAPWMPAAVAARQLETAIALEFLAYREYVKRTESQAWFKSATQRWIPAVAAQSRLLRGELGFNHARWRAEPTRRVAFMIHNASTLAHVGVLIETLAAVAKVGAGPYRFTAFVLNGRDQAMHDALTRAGVDIHYLGVDDAVPLRARLDALARRLKEDNFAVCLWISLITMMAVAFPLRIAPVQGWWAMKYHACDVDEIDFHLAMENVVETKRMDGIEWRTLGTGSAAWFDPALAAQAAEERARYGARAIVTGSIGREEKLNSPAFLDCVIELLRLHPAMVFLWTGKTRHADIQGRFERAGVAGRTHFIGWVNTKLIAQTLDIFLDSFPFPCGFTLKEAMAAGKPAVMFRSPEALETGVPGAITPVIEGTAQADPAARERLRTVFSRAAPFDLYCCADSPADYVRRASALIEDAALRTAVGDANRRFIAAFLSSPEDEARKFLKHLDHAFLTIPTAP